MNLADVMGAADGDQEPRRDQPAILDGEREVLMLAVLDRTVVVELDGERVLVRHERFDVDPHRLQWQRKALSAKRAYLRHRSRSPSRSA